MDFGDGLLRYPTQVFESLFGFTSFIVLLWLYRKHPRDGVLLTGFMTAYFLFRFFIEFIRSESRILFNLTGYQYAALVVLLYYGIRFLAPFSHGTFRSDVSA